MREREGEVPPPPYFLLRHRDKLSRLGDDEVGAQFYKINPFGYQYTDFLERNSRWLGYCFSFNMVSLHKKKTFFCKYRMLSLSLCRIIGCWLREIPRSIHQFKGQVSREKYSQFLQYLPYLDRLMMGYHCHCHINIGQAASKKYLSTLSKYNSISLLPWMASSPLWKCCLLCVHHQWQVF